MGLHHVGPIYRVLVEVSGQVSLAWAVVWALALDLWVLGLAWALRALKEWVLQALELVQRGLKVSAPQVSEVWVVPQVWGQVVPQALEVVQRELKVWEALQGA